MIIALTGPAGSGKSEVSRHLVEAHGFELIKFASPLKNMLRTLYRSMGVPHVEIERRIEGDLKEEPDPYLGGNTPRYAMQTLGTEWGRYLLGRNFWVNTWTAAARSTPFNVVVDDCRFNNEVDAVRDLGGYLWSLRPDETRRGTSDHASENGVTRAPDAILYNDGTIEDLCNAANEALFDLHYS